MDRKKIRQIGWVIGVVSLVVLLRLAMAAIETDNWMGFFYSVLHVAVVAVGSGIALAKCR